ncbi:glycosyltransferase [Methylomonas sp. LW13]|uniref:glycosyltransferase family 4 protein n=1 Tax=unclassified Methylomonas TaxID=2608980 RepID=UPI00051B2A11|nr:glycosyltransferase family 4 protein [Methylomonas sp. LW13]QBC25694.1 glycosyltransferase [Methylomonas sp. LW13]
MTRAILIATIMRPKGDTGVQTHFRAYLDYLDLRNQPSELITPYNAPLWQVYPVFAVRKLLIGAFSVWWYRYWHAHFLKHTLRSYLQSGKDCVIYAQCPISAEAALSARVSECQRVVMVTHFNISQADEWVGKGLIAKDGYLYRSIQRFEASVLPRVDGLVFVSQFIKGELINRIPEIEKVPSVVVPNFLPDPGLPDECEAVADLISIGTLETRKNQQYLLEIVCALREMGQPLTLTIVGDGPDRVMLEAKARALKVEDLVRFVGFVNNAAQQIALHRACIHVATIENLPITLIESMARGRPVFAAPVGGVLEILGDEVGGLAIPLNDAHAAARIVATALGNREWMLVTGSAARNRFIKEYASDFAARKLTAFLESI